MIRATMQDDLGLDQAAVSTIGLKGVSCYRFSEYELPVIHDQIVRTANSPADTNISQ